MKRKLAVCYRNFILIFHEFLMCIGWIFMRLQHTLNFTYRCSRWDIFTQPKIFNSFFIFILKIWKLEDKWGYSIPRETREGLPLLTLGVSCVSCQYKRFLFCFDCSSRPNTNTNIPLSPSLFKCKDADYISCFYVFIYRKIFFDLLRFV
jgi:hypothetical protein